MASGVIENPSSSGVLDEIQTMLIATLGKARRKRKLNAAGTSRRRPSGGNACRICAMAILKKRHPCFPPGYRYFRRTGELHGDSSNRLARISAREAEPQGGRDLSARDSRADRLTFAQIERS